MPGRVELDELHVHQPRTRPGARGTSPSPKFSSRRDELRRQIRVCPPPHSTTASATNAVRLPVVEVERERAEARAVGDQQLRDVVVLDDRDAELGDLRRPACAGSPARCSRRRSTCAASGGRRRTAGRATVVGAGELRNPTRPAPRRPPAPPGTTISTTRGSPRQVALAQRVGEVLLPRVLGIARAEGGVDPAGRRARCARRAGGRLPTTTTSAPAWWAAIAARRPAPPEPITRTLHDRVRFSGRRLTWSRPFPGLAGHSSQPELDLG